MNSFVMNRRKFLHTSATAGAAAAMLHPSMSWAAGGIASQELRTVGLSVTVQ